MLLVSVLLDLKVIRCFVFVLLFFIFVLVMVGCQVVMVVGLVSIV